MNETITSFTTSDNKRVTFKVADRRRYGNRMTYTYTYMEVNGEIDRTFTTDPWPAVQYPKGQLLWDARRHGFDVEPTKEAISFARRMTKEGRIFAIRKDDFSKFIAN